MHLHEILQSAMFWLCMVPFVILLADWSHIIYVNATRFIDDHPDQWDYGEYPIVAWMVSKLSELYYAYAVVSGILLFITQVFGSAVGDGVDHYARHLEAHGDTIFCGWAFLNVWIPGLYVLLVVSTFAIRSVMLYLRTIRRLEKAQKGQLILVQQSAEYQDYIDALGEAHNIQHIDADITRVKVRVYDGNIIDQQKLKDLGAAGVVIAGNGVQIIFGTRSEKIATGINRLL